MVRILDRAEQPADVALAVAPQVDVLGVSRRARIGRSLPNRSETEQRPGLVAGVELGGRELDSEAPARDVEEERDVAIS